MANFCSTSDRILSCLEDLERKRKEIESSRFSEWRIGMASRKLLDMQMAMSGFELEFKYLKLFQDCIHKWSDAYKVVPNLDYLATKIEATMEVIANQIDGSTRSFLDVERAPKWSALIPGVGSGIELKRQQKRVVEMEHLLRCLRSKVIIFEPAIAQVYDHYLTGHQFKSCFFWYDYGQWEKFVQLVGSKLNFVKQTQYGPIRAQIRAFRKKLTWATSFLGRVAESFPNNPKIGDFNTHIGNVTLHAALQLCHRWYSKRGENIDEDMMLTLSYLESKIDFTNPEFLSVNLSLLKSFQAVLDKSSAATQVNKFVELLLEFPQLSTDDRLDLKMPCAFHGQFVSLILSASNFSEEETEDMRRFLTDFKEVGTDVAPLNYTWEARIVLEGRIHVLNLLAKIWLMKLEIFLKEQVTTGNIFLLPGEKQIKALNQAVGYLDLEERLSSMRSHIEDAPEGNTKNIKLILIFLDKVAKEVTYLNLFAPFKDIPRKMVRNILFELLIETVLFKSEAFLVKLGGNSECSIILAKEGIEALCGGLKILIMFVKNHSEGNTDGENKVFAHILAMASREISLCFSFNTNDATEETMKDFCLLASDLLDEIKVIMVELKDIYLHVPRSNAPRTNILGFIDSLMIKLRELFNYKADLVASLKGQIKYIMEDLEFFKIILRDIIKEDIEVTEWNNLHMRVIDVAYEAEYLIDSIVGENVAKWYGLVWLFNFIKDIRQVKLQVENIYEKRTSSVRLHQVAQTSRRMILQAISPKTDEDLVGLNDQEEVIIDRLTRGTLQRNIVPIIGMPGIGKTTLAKKVYGDSNVVYHFHVKAWCSISQAYEKRELLLGILSHIIKLTDDILEMTDEDLELKLYQNLKQKRYLVVMDDMWDTRAWDDLERSLPNDLNGSRILFTSRLETVALEAQPDSDLHFLRLLSDTESWDLLQSKILHEESCPVELMQVGKKIAKHCRGLPLAVVAIAGLLLRTERQLVWWNEIAESLSSRIVDDPQMHCMEVLELSYKHLPDQLKSCFLYFAAFLEDEDIPVKKLTQLWIAEGFIPRIYSKSIEEIAEEYLMDLIGRSLVMVARRRSDGGVKACRVHDMLHSLCLSKAKEENFLRQFKVSEDASFDSLDYGDFDDYIPSNPLRFEDHRLSIYSKRKHFVLSQTSGRWVRSLLFFATSDMYPTCPYDISFIPKNFKFLKLLNLECINMGASFPKGIESLIQLCYLAVTGDIDSFPPSVANLWNLETFLVKGLKGKVVMPDTVWHMSGLRHLDVKTHTVFRLPDDNCEHFSQLDKLVTLSSLFLLYGEDADKMIRRFPCLQKLKCIFSESLGYLESCNYFPRLDFLSQLHSLRIGYSGRAFNPIELNFPLNLKKLTVSSFRLPWDHISPIGRLPNLEVLKLISRAFEGERWDMREGEFSKLKFLKLDTLNLVQWNATSDDLPNLQHLVLRSCRQLEEVPYSLAEISTMRRIEVLWCGQSCQDSARYIMEEEIEGLEVFINLAFSDIS